MDSQEVITLHSYRWKDKFAVVVSRTRKKDINKNSVYHFAAGEHSGLIVNNAIKDRHPPELQDSMQIPILCELNDSNSGKKWPEVRRLLINFRKDYTTDVCKAAALDFHHDLLHPEIFQRDYCGFIITMMKILQHRYPEISSVTCSFETLSAINDDSIKAVLKLLEMSYPQKLTPDQISSDLKLDYSAVIMSLTNLIEQNLVEKMEDKYFIKAGIAPGDISENGSLPGYIVEVLKSRYPNGLTAAQISEYVGSSLTAVQSALDTLVEDQIEYVNDLYYYGTSTFPSDEHLEALIELLEGTHPNGLTPLEILDKMIISETLLPRLLEYTVEQGYTIERAGVYYIRRLEDKEINLVFDCIKNSHPNGVTSNQIMEDTNLAEIVVVSSINILEEKGDVKNIDDVYHVTTPQVAYTEHEYEKIKSQILMNYSGSYYPQTISHATNINESSVIAVLSNMCLMGDIMQKSNGVYGRRPVSGALKDNVLNLITMNPTNGVSLTELALNIDEGEFYTNLITNSLISDDLVVKRGTLFFPVIKTTKFEDIPHQQIVRVYDAVASTKVAPKGNTVAQIAQRLDITPEVAQVVLTHLTNSRLLTLQANNYSKQTISDVDCSAVLIVLAKKYPIGINLEEINRYCPQFSKERLWFILRDLIAAKKAKNTGELYMAVKEETESRCTDSDIGFVLRGLEAASPGGLTIREISMKCRIEEVVVRKALSNLTCRSFVTTSGDKYYSRNFEEDCDEIVGILKNAFPEGIVLSEICRKVGIQSQLLVKEILRYLIDEKHSVELLGKLYYYVSSLEDRKISHASIMRRTLLTLVSDVYPNGLTIQEIQKSTNTDPELTSQVLSQLVTERNVFEQNNKYFYNPKSALSGNDYEQVLRILEAAYPNSMSLYSVCKESKMSEENVVLILGTFKDQKQVAEVDRNVFMRSASILDKSMKRGDVQNAKEPRIAIFTADYGFKVAVDVMMTNITTYLKYKLGGESSVYTLGQIGKHRVVATKFSHGYSKASAISIGNATTRLLGTFPRIEHVFVIGLGGGVINTTEISRHVRLGDVVVSYPGTDESIYYMATNFVFPSTDSHENIADSTVSYTVKRWNCLDPRLHNLVGKLHEKTKDLAVFPWEEYISEGQSALGDDVSSYGFHRPAQMTDPLSIQRGVRGSILPKVLEGRPRMCLGTIGAGRYLHRVDNLKDQFVERSRVIAFDDEYDQVTESIHGNCVDSFIFIRGISDYADGSGNEMWQSYAALASVGVMRYILENLEH